KALADAFLGEPVARADESGGETVGSDAELVERMASALAAGECVGWVRGRFEWGTRSLGHRTILANPMREGIREHIAGSVNGREPFLPLCCAVPAERAAEYFDLPKGAPSAPRFLQISTAPRNGTEKSIPAAVHFDHRARPHLVDRETDPQFHALLTKFGE